MNIRRNSLFVLILLLSGWLTATTYAQSPWTQSHAGFYAQAGVQAIPYWSQLLNSPDGTLAINSKIRELTTQFYGEYGLKRQTTAIVVVPLRWANRQPLNSGDPAAASLFGLGNTTLGLKRGFEKKGFNMAGTLQVDLPATGGYKQGLRTGFNTFTLRPSVSIGKGFRRAYTYIYGGVGLRTHAYSNYFQGGAEGGVKLGQCWIIAFTDYLDSWENANIRMYSAPTGLFMDRQSWWAWGLKTIIPVNRFTGIVLTGSSALSGNNVAAQPAFSVSGFFKWD